jgi:hypothetical protein
LNTLLPEPLVRHQGPSTLVTTLNEQRAEQRAVLHLLHYIPERRSQEIDVIEDVIPVYGIGVSLRLDRGVAVIRLAPEGESCPVLLQGGRVRFTVPEVRGRPVWSPSSSLMSGDWREVRRGEHGIRAM